MLSRIKGNSLFHRLMKRHDINKAYAMVGPEDSWYDTITTVHNSVAKIHGLPHESLETPYAKTVISVDGKPIIS